MIALGTLDDIVSSGTLSCSPTASALALDEFPDDGLFFRTGPSELGVHPTDPAVGPHHQISLVCDDIRATLEEAMAGARFYDLHHPWFHSP